MIPECAASLRSTAPKTCPNVFSLLATCTRALKKAGCRDLAEELRVKVMAAGSYDEAIQIMMTYVDVE